MFIFIILINSFYINSSFANFLSYTEKNVVAQKMQTPSPGDPMAAMMSKIMKPAKPDVSYTKNYIHKGKLAIHSKKQIDTLMDFNTGKIFNFDYETKSYTMITIDSLIKGLKSEVDKKSMKFKSQYKKLKGMKTIFGKKCSLYSGFDVLSSNSSQEDSGNSSLNCIWMNPPKAWVEYRLKGIELVAPHTAQIFKSGDLKSLPDIGMPLYTRSVQKLSGGGNPQVEKFMPIMESKTSVQDISVEPFSLSKFKIPNGFKKLNFPVFD